MVDPECQYFGACGGCAAQDVSYDKQLEKKRQLLSDLLGRDDIKVFSGAPYGYRNRMDFIFHPGGLGLREKRNWRQIVDVTACSIADPRINALLAEVRSFFKGEDIFHLKKQTGTFRYAVLRVAEDASVSFVLNADSMRLAQATERIREFADSCAADHVVVARVGKQTDVSTSLDSFAVKGEEYLHQTILGKRFAYPIQGFFQNNHAMAEELHQYCRHLLQDDPSRTQHHHLLDLYGGVGTFGIINADLYKGVSIIESFPAAIETAKRNITANGVDGKVQAVVKDAKSLASVDLPQPLHVITDPPRTGMHQRAIQRLRDLAPDTILYVSCNPHQLRKELSRFSEYEMRSAAMFDLFPQTPHLEAVVELIRKTP